mgnify:FL=1
MYSNCLIYITQANFEVYVVPSHRLVLLVCLLGIVIPQHKVFRGYLETTLHVSSVCLYVSLSPIPPKQMK